MNEIVKIKELIGRLEELITINHDDHELMERFTIDLFEYQNRLNEITK